MQKPRAGIMKNSDHTEAIGATHRSTPSVLCSLGAMFILTCGAMACSRVEVASHSDQLQTAKTETGIDQAAVNHDVSAEPASGTRGFAPRVAGGTPIDTSAEDAEIKRLEQAIRKQASDAQTEQALARAYAVRAARLTEAQQYRAALGDWRRAVKLDPTNAEAQNMIATITNIMQSMNRPVPASGAEPSPLPFKKRQVKGEK